MDSRRSYSELHSGMLGCPDRELLGFLDSGSLKLVNAVAGVITQRRIFDRVYESLCSGDVKTALGRKVALSILLYQGRQYPRSYDACVQMTADRSKRVVEEALFGLCLWNNPAALPALDHVRAPGTEKLVSLAREALKAGDFRLYSPYFEPGSCWST